MDYFTLRNGVKLPKIGYGTYKITNEDAKITAFNALKLGYRHIDTAIFYNNEQAIGEAIRRSDIPREDIFVTTKLWTSANSYNSAIEFVKDSLSRLKLSYIDMILIHWPTPNNAEVWRALEDLYNDGLIRVIGTSNFKQHHITELMDTAKIAPLVNQVELHPYFQQLPLRNFGQDMGIQVEAWSPLLRGGLFFDPVLNNLATKYNKSIAQIALRFLIQEGISVIPKSVDISRMSENIDIFNFEIEDDDMCRIRALNKNIRYYRDPDRHGF